MTHGLEGAKRIVKKSPSHSSWRLPLKPIQRMKAAQTKVASNKESGAPITVKIIGEKK